MNELREKILTFNNKFIEGDFDCNSTVFDFLVIVQVHERFDFLKILLESLIGAKGSYFVVISADVYDEGLLTLVRSTLGDVCHSIVFHSYSMAFWRDQYPAEDPRDCTRDQKTNLENCNSEAKADSYGHYREVKFSQIKLHWSWKLNFITEHFTRDYSHILLLEEDYYVSEDIFDFTKNQILPNLDKCEETSNCLGALGKG